MRILVKIFPQESHFNATLPIARNLAGRGHELVYAGRKEFESRVSAQGFSYLSQDEDLLPPLTPMPPDSGRLRRPWLPASRTRFAWRGPPTIPADGFDTLVRSVNPDAVIVDSPYARYSPALLKHRIPFGIIESMPRLDYHPAVPPLSSQSPMARSALGRTRIRLIWRGYWLRSSLGAAWGGMSLPTPRQFEPFFPGQAARHLDFRRYFHVGVRNVPEIILSPEEFDFPRPRQSNQVYAGPSVDLNRAEVGFDHFYRDRISLLLRRRAEGAPLVYCSLGSAAWRYPAANGFLKRMISGCADQPFGAIIVVGPEVDARWFGPLPPNVVVLYRAPQLELLRQADAAVTHGGMNTITECILSGVPMLACPGSAELDQPGNAARVAFHGLGLAGTLGLTVVEIRSRLRRLLRETQFKSNVVRMADRIRASEAYNRGAEIVLEALGGER